MLDPDIMRGPMIPRKWSDNQYRNCQACALTESSGEGITIKSLTISLCLLLLPLAGYAQDVHPDIQAALDWQLPANDCKPPVIKQSNVTSGQERKLKRAAKKYEKCLGKYRAILGEEQQKMMDSAVHGLTQDQADTIMWHLKVIQKVLQPATVAPVSALELDDSPVFLAMQQEH